MRTNQCLFMWYLVQTASPKYDCGYFFNQKDDAFVRKKKDQVTKL